MSGRGDKAEFQHEHQCPSRNGTELVIYKTSPREWVDEHEREEDVREQIVH